MIMDAIWSVVAFRRKDCGEDVCDLISRYCLKAGLKRKMYAIVQPLLFKSRADVMVYECSNMCASKQ